jgi:AcrR family transcriptional regulator
LPYGTVLTGRAFRTTIRDRMDKILGREDWLRAARLALLRGGVEAVRVERLARDLGVTKGSFYWHFKDRDELLEFLLREWESEVPEILSEVGRGSENEKIHGLIRLVEQRANLSEEGKVPSDAAIFAWAAVDREVARRVNKAEEARIQLLKQFVGGRDQMDLFYLLWLGFVARGQRVPESRKRFHEIARFLVKSLSESRSPRRMQQRSKERRRHPAKRVRG